MAKQRKRPEETDLDQLKHLAAVFLELDIVPTKLSPVVVKHPFTVSGVVGIPGKDGEASGVTRQVFSPTLWKPAQKN